MASRRNFHRSGLLASLRGIPLAFARIGWLVVFVLTVGTFFASIPAYYDWLVNLSRPGLEPATVRTNLEAMSISVGSYAAYQLSMGVVSAMVYSVVSVIIFWRKSDDWMALLTSAGLLAFGIFFLTEGPGVLAKQYPAVWLPVQTLAFLGSISFVLFLYLFPDGRFLPWWTRWIPIFWVAHDAAYYFFPGSIFNINRTFPLLDFVVSSAVFFIGAGSQLYRYRRVLGPIQRQQAKWAIFGIASAALGAIVFAFPLNISPALAQYGSPYTFALEAGVYGSLLLIPLSIGVAILRHRLWDIDIVINRTLVYGILTVSLALVYFGGVAATQVVFRALTGQEEQPQIAIVVSTLVIAALFNPLRRRIQSFIDRRFYHRKYDARKTLEAFSVMMRDETDLDALSEDLVGVVRETMQPAHVSLWLRPETDAKGEQEVKS
jgi:hypothetical protein